MEGVGIVLDVSKWVYQDVEGLRDYKRGLVGLRTFAGPPAWQSSCRNGLLAFTVPGVTDSRGSQAPR